MALRGSAFLTFPFEFQFRRSLLVIFRFTESFLSRVQAADEPVKGIPRRLLFIPAVALRLFLTVRTSLLDSPICSAPFP